jgi:hypothetical protein
MKFEKVGVPPVSFEAIIPKDQQIYSYYGLPNPK